MACLQHLYETDWNPRGVRKEWERCMMEPRSTALALGWAHERMLEAACEVALARALAAEAQDRAA